MSASGKMFKTYVRVCINLILILLNAVSLWKDDFNDIEDICLYRVDKDYISSRSDKIKYFHEPLVRILICFLQDMK